MAKCIVFRTSATPRTEMIVQFGDSNVREIPQRVSTSPSSELVRAVAGEALQYFIGLGIERSIRSN